MVKTTTKDFLLLGEPCLSLEFVFYNGKLLFKFLSAKVSQVRTCPQIKIDYNISSQKSVKKTLVSGFKSNCELV